MSTYTAHVTPSDGIPRRIALAAFDMAAARREAMLLARARFGRNFSFSVRAAA